MTAPTATQPWGPPTNHPPRRKQGPPRKRPPIFTHPLRVLEGATSPPTTAPPHHGQDASHTRRRATKEAMQHRHLTHRHRHMETHTGTSAQASHQQQRHELPKLRHWTRLRIHAKTKQRRSRSHHSLQQGRNRHTRQHSSNLPMVQPAQRQRTQPNRSAAQNNRAGNKH